MKKTMRKSALLSSVAMLIVSAIVLTSATYAWFSSSKDVSVTGIDSTVKVTDGLLISFTGQDGSWNTTLKLDSSKLPQNWVPVSSDFTGSNPEKTFVKGSAEDDILTLGAATAGTDYVMYDLYVQGPAGKEVRLHIDSKGATVDPFAGTGTGAKPVVKFAFVDESGNLHKSGVVAADNTTTGYTGTSQTGTFDNTKYSGDAYNIGGESISEKTLSEYGFTLPATVGQNVHFKVYVWVEGNDTDCTNTKILNGNEIAFNLKMSIDGTTTNS